MYKNRWPLSKIEKDLHLKIYLMETNCNFFLLNHAEHQQSKEGQVPCTCNTCKYIMECSRPIFSVYLHISFVESSESSTYCTMILKLLSFSLYMIKHVSHHNLVISLVR